VKRDVSQKVKGSDNIQIAGNVSLNIFNKDETDEILSAVQKQLYFLLSCGLIATTIPDSITNQVACIIVLLSAVLIFGIAIYRSNNKCSKRRLAASAMLLLSLASGCGGPMLAKIQDPKLTDLASKYKAGTVEGFGVFGFGLDDITIESAANQGEIKNIHFVDSSRSYGLISYAKVTVFGK